MQNLAELLIAAQARLAATNPADLPSDLPEIFQNRGLSLPQLLDLKLGLDEDGHGVIPIQDRDGKLLGLKLRLNGAYGHKYRELPDPNGNPPWLAPAPTAPVAGLLLVEGELNAMVCHIALKGTPCAAWQVCGLGSTFGPVPWPLAETLQVSMVFMVDPGRAGAKSMQGWLAEAGRKGLSASRRGPLLGNWDACEYAHTCGLEALGSRLTGLLIW